MGKQVEIGKQCTLMPPTGILSLAINEVPNMKTMGGRVFLTAILIAGCGDSTGGNLAQPASLTLVPSTVSFEALTETEQLTATVRDALGNELNSTVEFLSSDNTVVSVNATGLLTAEGVGTAEVTASAGSLTKSASVTVTQVATGLLKVSGDAQSGPVTTALTQPLVVRVVDARSNGIAGLGVTFSLNEPTASLSVASATTSADGTASTTLTLGSLAGGGYRVTARSEIAAAGEAVFVATGLPDVPVSVSPDSGDGQRQPLGAVLPKHLVVKVLDQFGNGVPDHPVTFAAGVGNGSVDPAVTSTDAAGFARTRWTIGNVLGDQQATADAGSVAGSPLTFTATGTDLAVTDIQPATLVPGQPATITGTGFDGNAANDTVLIDNVLAVINTASATTLDVTVPPGACRTAGSVDVLVSTALGGTTAPTSHPWAPAEQVSLAVGEQTIIQDPSSFCLQFGATAASEEYLLGVQNASFIAGLRTSARIIGSAVGGAPGTAVAPDVLDLTAPVALDPAWERRRRHREAEIELRAAQREDYLNRTLVPDARMGAAVVIDSTVQPGETFQLKIPDIRPGMSSCNDSETLTATVQVVGQRGIWLADSRNPSGGFTTADYQGFSDQLDNQLYPTDVAYFGEPSDGDGNGRILILITSQINEWSQTILGFVSPADLVPLAECPSSNEAEIFYGRAPDPNGIVNGVYPLDAARGEMPPLIAHEFSHIIQLSRRRALGPNEFMSAFMAEGQATLAEEVAGHAVLGNTVGENYSFSVGFGEAASGVSWYALGLNDMAYYFGRNLPSPNESIDGAPERCSWRTPFGTPCGGRSLWYGVTWSFLRWISDHLGGTFAGGEQELHRFLIDNTNNGFANIEGVVGLPVDSLLAQWAAAIYVDDRVTGAATRLTIPSWNYFSMFGTSNLSRSSRLIPPSLGYGVFQSTTEVVSGSTAYYLISGADRPATAVRVRDVNDSTLPNHMQIFLVRIQ
jgi:hypothetical protein